MKKRLWFALVFILPALAQALAKYGPNAIPLSKDSNHQYFVRQRAPDFWALMPFYVGQDNDSACSAAALATVLNGARHDYSLSSSDELVTQKSLTEKYSDDKYKYSVCGDMAAAVKNGVSRLGVSVERLAEILKMASGKLKIEKSKIELVVVDQKNREASRKKFHEYLLKNEKSGNDFILLNFTQGMLTGDPEGMIGHIAAVGGYDQEKKMVLVLDPDRRWYGPYWSPEDKVFDAVADPRSDAAPGYVYFKFK